MEYRPGDAGSSKVATVLRVTSGNFLEMYDFFLAGVFAKNIGQTFFPTDNEYASLMLSFATFAISFFMRPLGAIFLGAYIDKIGRRQGLSGELVKLIEDAEARTARNDRFFLNIAFNYGGQADIVDAARRFAEAVAAGRAQPGELDEAVFARALATADSPPPDLVVRPSGEQRLSNFLLWESAYAELVFQDVLWPDYGAEHLKAALDVFAGRDRRYGAILTDDVLATG